MAAKNLDTFFYPQTVAVIGASGRNGSVGFTIFQNMKRARIKKLFAVNPKHGKVQGITSYESIMLVPRRVDLAVIALPSSKVPQALEECMRARAKAAIIVSAGFSETGEKKATAKIEELLRKNMGTLVMGPNCVGVLNTANNLDTTFFERDRMSAPKKGTLAFISQSGALGSMILDWSGTQRFGISKFASYGNAMGIDEADLIEYLGRDDETKVITAYIEGVKEGRKFCRVAREISRKKPIVVLKGGRYESTTRATASHTGSLAGSAKVYDAVFRDAGIIQADDLTDLFAVAKLLEQQPLPKGKRVQIITNGGGFGIIAADQVVGEGLKLAKPAASTARKLGKIMPRATISNPMDLLGDADARKYEAAINAALKDRNNDIILVLCLFNLPTLDAGKLALALKRARKRSGKPIVAIAIGSEYTERRMNQIEKSGVSTFNYPGVAAKAISKMAQYAQTRKK
ncbi:MAG: CoA-binding protein [Candidatus Diapherotrites archaeon]|uniref:CoA-binding protein n=1 Tax=Candidatus Iainarchaeum sp. TaxID=3101447 RepID=A0A8T3YMJ7_9ARCH|nr:CoA-binding protein [Candidatus Diapherotrites archaeon]